MKSKEKKMLFFGLGLILAFIAWTVMVMTVDYRAVGVKGTSVGFSSFNTWFHSITGVHMTLYVITDWLGLVPLFVCFTFAGVGLVQLIKRRSLFKLDLDIIFLGVYYILVIFGYLIFEMIPLNYRPILINGFMEASYPSSTTLLVLSVMPTLTFQCSFRLKNMVLKRVINVITVIFSVFMVLGRLIAGVHWFTDIVGSVLLCGGLFYSYKAIALLTKKE
ncbi:MAG: phosphatase PAP2 family protein [Ruminococcaceae bacterium]|nr:phosphatase PAP2 family protein [Oscillospiraceae bacterium]